MATCKEWIDSGGGGGLLEHLVNQKELYYPHYELFGTGSWHYGQIKGDCV